MKLSTKDKAVGTIGLSLYAAGSLGLSLMVVSCLLKAAGKDIYSNNADGDFSKVVGIEATASASLMLAGLVILFGYIFGKEIKVKFNPLSGARGYFKLTDDGLAQIEAGSNSDIELKEITPQPVASDVCDTEYASNLTIK